jgi:hypothetical protein
MMNQTQKKSHLIRNIAIAAIVIILLFIVVNYTFRSSKPTLLYFGGGLYILPSKFMEVDINVPYGKDISLSIDFYVTESTNFVNWQTGGLIYCYIMNSGNFTNWENNQQAYFIFNSGLVTTASVTISLPRPGWYFIVFDNTFSASHFKFVSYTLTLTYYT